MGIVENILRSRGTNKESLDLNLSNLTVPSGMADMSRSVKRVASAIKNKEPIHVYGDYDADGVTSTCIVQDYLSKNGGIVSSSVANRSLGYGYVFDKNTLEGVKLLILLDCGTNDFSNIKKAKDTGVDVIVIDHHEVRSKFCGYSLINPKRPDCKFGHQELCTAGLAFFFCCCLSTEMSRSGIETTDPRDVLDLSAIGTVADMCDLSNSDNRIIVSEGLRILNKNQKKRPGLWRILINSHLSKRRVTSDSIAWKIAPRLNAPGRIGDAELSLRALSEKDRDEAKVYANNVEKINKKRKDINAKALEEALSMVRDTGQDSDKSIVVWSDNWIPGIVGIISGRLKDTFNVPSFVISIDCNTGRGSCRSPAGISVINILRECEGCLVSFGGHSSAAGFTLDTKMKDALYDKIKLTCSKIEPSSVAECTAEADISIDEISNQLFVEIESMGPFGKGWTRPVFSSCGFIDMPPGIKKDHAFFSINSKKGNSLRCVMWGGAPQVRTLQVSSSVRVFYTLEEDQYVGGIRANVIKIVPQQ